ncbi:MAG: PAS domain S-box protein, partial [Halobacteria archaeon]|nr:PAS domain S-box protein [Halobacteria archaeon]
EMNGYEREEMIGMTVDEFSGEDGEFDHERAKELIQKAAEEGSQTFEWLNETKDGEEFWAEVSLKKTVINGRDRVLAVVRDVTDRKERQRQLDRTNTVLETILENLTTGILVEDPSREILAANPALCEILGTSIPAEELEGRDCSKAAEEMKGLFENPERFVRRTEEAVEGGERVLSDEFELSDGRTVERDYVPYSHPDGDTHLWLYRDITERKRRERRLERRNERLDEFAEAVSHELKNPLNVVSGRVELAQEECDSEHLETAEEVVGRMEDIVEKSLSLARDGEEVNERREVDLESTVVECWRNVDTRDAEIRVEDDAVVEADPSRIKNVFENLFRNAVEHGTTDDSPDTGTSDDEGVTVRVGTFDGGIFVEDDGTGMGKEEMDSIFDLGYSDTEHRAGFGLAVVRRVVEAHGWEVEVGESEDGGARFEIRGVDFGETD